MLQRRTRVRFPPPPPPPHHGVFAKFAGTCERNSRWCAACGRHVLLAGVLAALVGALLVRFAAVRLGADVRRLSKAARDIELGVPGAHLPPAASSAELRSLSDALGRMTTRLMATQDDLERQVRERTAELEAANAELGRQARTDPLTGLPNRRSFDLQMDHALAAARHTVYWTAGGAAHGYRRGVLGSRR